MGTIRYLLVIAVVSILFGLGLDSLYQFLDIEARAVISEVRETMPYWLKLSSAMILIALFLYRLWDQYRLWKLKSRKNQFIADFPTIDAQVENTRGNRQIAVLVKSARNSKDQKD